MVVVGGVVGRANMFKVPLRMKTRGEGRRQKQKDRDREIQRYRQRWERDRWRERDRQETEGGERGSRCVGSACEPGKSTTTHR